MAKKTINNKYFIKRKETDEWVDATIMFDGLNILSVSGFNSQGDAQNVYTAKWINSQTEDFCITGDSIVRANVDLSLTFICGTRYSTNNNVDTQNVYDAFVSYINHGDFYIKSAYSNKYAHVVCLKEFKPTTEKLHRGINSYILATVPLHCLDAAVVIQ